MEKQYEHFDLQRLNDINIVEVARQLDLPVRRDGVNYVTNCLWHDDEHPSLVLYNKQGNQHCHCYSCNEHHSVIDLAMKAVTLTVVQCGNCHPRSRMILCILPLSVSNAGPKHDTDGASRRNLQGEAEPLRKGSKRSKGVFPEVRAPSSSCLGALSGIFMAAMQYSGILIRVRR